MCLPSRSSPLRRLPFLSTLILPLFLILLLFVATSTCDGGSGDAQKEATAATLASTPEDAAKDDVPPPTGLEPAVAEGGGHEGAEEEAAASAVVEASTKAEARRGGGVGGRGVEAGRKRGGSGGGVAAATDASSVALGRGRRRHADYSTRAPQWSRPQPPHSPHTMSQSLYDHFRPLDPELPSGDILPFLQFGMKLPSVPARVKTHIQTSSTTVPPPRSTTFPSASTNALTEEREEDTDNDMAGLVDGPQSRTQPHSTRTPSKLKAAILLQMMVNNVRRKKLALRGNLRSKEGLKEAGEELKDEGGDGGRERGAEWGVRKGGERSRERLEVLQEGAGDEVSKEESLGVTEKLESAEKEETGVSSGEEAKGGTGEVVKEGEGVAEVEEDSAVVSNPKRRVVLIARRKKKINEEEEDSDSTNVAVYGISPNLDADSEVLQNDAPADDAMRETVPVYIPPEIVEKEWKVAPAPKTHSQVEEQHSENSQSNLTASSANREPVVEVTLEPMTSSIGLPETIKPSTSTSTITSTISTTVSTSTTTPIPPTSSPTTTTTASTTTTSTPPTTTSSTSTLSTATSPTSTTPTSTTPITTSSTSIGSTTTLPNTTTTTVLSTMPATSNTTPSISPRTTTTPVATISLRIPSTHRVPHYPTVSTTHSTQTVNSTRPPYRHPLFPSRDHHRSSHVVIVPPNIPGLRRPTPFPTPYVPNQTRKLYVPSSYARTTTTTTPVPPKKEPPVKVEIDARDWVAVPPPNTTSSPSSPTRTSTHKSPIPSPPPTKPHPNGVEKGWQRPSHPSLVVPPHVFQSYNPIEHHFSLPWHPAGAPHSSRSTTWRPSTTSSTTTEREVLSVVTSVSVESSPQLDPVSSTVSPTQPNVPVYINLGESEPPSLTEVPKNDLASEAYPSQFPHVVGVFEEDNEEELQSDESDPDVVAEPGMGATATYVLLSLAIVPGVVAIVSATRCLLLHRQKNLYESETSSEVSCMGGRTLKTCTRGSHINHTIAAEESGTMRPGSDVFRAITRLPRVAHLGWEHERRRQRGKGGRSDGGMLEGEEVPAREEEHSTKEDEEIGNWEFPRSKLRLQTLLGQGNFGQVWKAEADGICDGETSTRLVAVKLVKVKEGGDEEEEVVAVEGTLSQCNVTQSPLSPTRRHGEPLTPMEQCRRKRREEFMAELGIMQLLSPPHPNVVTLLGCCTTTEPPLLIMEYVMFGKLLTFLREHRCKRRYANVSDDPEILTSRDLLVFAYCVIKGMEYLVSKGVVHRDLAARNILVDHNKTCKIADFGMSRSVRETGGQIYEEKQKQGALPVRWMAPESLFRGMFTHKSDVWSFGVLLWEIITLGSTPYPGIGARDVMRRVRDGRRLERPSHVRPEIFRVAARCWHRDSSLRPTFSRLRADMGPLLASASAGISRGSGAVDNDMCLVSNRGNRRWRPPGPQIDLNQFEDDSG